MNENSTTPSRDPVLESAARERRRWMKQAEAAIRKVGRAIVHLAPLADDERAYLNRYLNEVVFGAMDGTWPPDMSWAEEPRLPEAEARERFTRLEQIRDEWEMSPHLTTDEYCPTCRATPGQLCVKRGNLDRGGPFHFTRVDKMMRHRNRDIGAAPWPEYRVPGHDYRSMVKVPSWAESAR